MPARCGHSEWQYQHLTKTESRRTHYKEQRGIFRVDERPKSPRKHNIPEHGTY